jgi:iron complex outermembrane recepter protein
MNKQAGDSFKVYACVATAVAMLVQGGVAVAAQAAAPEDKEGTLEEVVVTAERREETLQKTPIAIAAVGQEEMTRAGVTDAYSLNKLVPDLNITQSAGGFAMHLRGVFYGGSEPTGEAPIALAVDGAPMVKNLALNGMQYDLARVEVLKGPQGTLYGRNSTGGAINFVSNRPDFSDSGRVELEAGNYNLLRIFGAGQTAISDTLAVRAAFQTLNHRGYMASGLYDAKQTSARVSALWKPNDKDEVLVVADTAQIGGHGIGVVPIGRLSLAEGGSPKAAAFVIPTNPFNDVSYNGTNALPLKLDSVNNGIMAQWVHKFDSSSLTVQVADRWFVSHPFTQTGGVNVDFTGIVNPASPTGAHFTNGPYYNPGLPAAGVTDFWSQFHSDTVEARLASTGSQSLQWVVGIAALSDVDKGDLGAWPTWNTGLPWTQYLYLAEKAYSGSVFTQETWTPDAAPKLHLTAGYRYNLDRKSGNFMTLLGGGAQVAGNGANDAGMTQVSPVVAPTDPNFKNPYGPGTYATGRWTGSTHRLAINYDFTDTVMGYISEARGYKPGGFGYGPTPRYEPETNTAWEAGIKSRWLDNRLQFNFSAYKYDYKNIEAGYSYNVAQASGPALPIISVTNVGDQEFYGAEFDVQFMATPDDRLQIGGSAEHAKYLSYQVKSWPNYVIPGVTINPATGLPYTSQPAGSTNSPPPLLAGTPVPLTPEWSGTASYDHTFHLGNGGAIDTDLFVTFRGRQLYTYVWAGYPNAQYPDPNAGTHYVAHPLWDTTHFVPDFSLKYSAPGNKWTITAYVHNMFDQLVFQTKGASTSTGLITGTPQPPRTYGLIWGYKF